MLINKIKKAFHLSGGEIHPVFGFQYYFLQAI